MAARLIVLLLRPVPLSPWLPVAWLWQDVAIILTFALFERLVRGAWPVRIMYWALVLLCAFNVPVILVLGSPLTAPMLRAARGTLSDSILYHATPANVAIAVGLAALGAVAPRLWLSRTRAAKHSYSGVRARWLVALSLAVVLAGPAATKRSYTAGLERNPVFSIARTVLPRMPGSHSDTDWRASLSGAGASEDQELDHLRGAAQGSNVLLIVLESTGANYLRPYGAAEDPMPNLSELAERAIVFENAYAVYPESVKGIVTYLASRYAGFDIPNERHAAVASPSLATVLRSEGYATALFHSGRFMYLGMDQVVAASGFDRAEDAGDIGGNRNSSFGVDEPAAVERILSWIDSLPRTRAFFAVYLPVAGHHPYTFSEAGPFPVADEVGRYRNALFEGDRALGALLAGITDRGLDSSTMVVVLADHGEAFGQHAGNYGHTLALYEENVKVPMLFALPVQMNANGRVGRVASMIDVAPTVLDLLGAEVPREFQGRSLLDAADRMALFFTDYSLGLLGARDGCLKYIHEMESDRSRVFDLCSDPRERRDLAKENRSLVSRLREHLRAWSAAQVALLESSRRR